MRYGFLTILLPIMLSASLASQTHAKPFHWDGTKAQDFDHSPTVRASKKLSEDERKALLKRIARQINPRLTDAQLDADHKLLKTAAETRIKFIDLNGDGIPEIVAQASGGLELCGATGNCQFWILAKDQDDYRVILAEGSAQIFTIESTSHEGFHDIVLANHESAVSMVLYAYHYQNGQYRQTDCYNAAWFSLENGRMHGLKEPLLTPCSQ